MEAIQYDPRLVEIKVSAKSRDEVLKILADDLKALDYVTDDFYEHVIQREKDFPTGLPTVIPMALCHTEAQYVKQAAICVATLAKPVEFQEMGTPENLVQAEMVFLIAMKNPKDQVPWLRKMMEFCKDKSALETIRDATDKQSLAEFLRQKLS
jgi:PTS system galactitol-specific IIA component